MIGTGLKKYAEELGFECSNGVAYGVHNGYMLTLKEGSGYKSMTAAVSFFDAQTKADIEALLADAQFRKDNRILGAVVTDAMIEVRFNDTIGTLKVMKNAVEIILTKLADAEIGGAACCNACHGRFEEGMPGEDVLIDGNVFCMHSGCIDSLDAGMKENAERIKSQGSVGGGIVGAFLGALVGAVPWALASYFGGFVALFGLVVGIASKKGYELLGGKETKLKPIAVLICSLLSVVIVEIVVYVMVIMASVAEVGVMYTVPEAFQVFMYLLAEDGEVASAVVIDLVMSWLFVILGIFNMIKDTFKGTSSALATPIRLKK